MEGWGGSVATEVLVQSLNIGVVDKANLHRTDLERMRLTAELQTNFIPKATGPASLRSGTEYLGTAANSGADETTMLDFIASENDRYGLEFSDRILRVWDESEDVSQPGLITRPDVSGGSGIVNGDFSSSTGWTVTNSAGADSDINSTNAGKLTLRAYAEGATTTCVRSATAHTTGTANGIEHALRIIVTRGPVLFRCGTTSGGDDLIGETVLRTGTFSLAFLPDTGSTYYVWFSVDRDDKNYRIVDSIQIEAAGAMELPTNWSDTYLSLLRVQQSLDVMFVAASGFKQQRIERRAYAVPGAVAGTFLGRSWGVCDYDSDDGPFSAGRTANVTLTPGALRYNTTLTASSAFFTTDHVGALFKLRHTGQNTEARFAALDAISPTFMVTGVNETDYNDRDWSWTSAGTWVGTLRVERSFDGEDIEFHEFRRAKTVSTVDVTANATYANDDNEDNAVAWYRIKQAAYTSGLVVITTTYDGGGGYGICRVTGFVSATQVTIEVLVPFKNTTATEDWQEGEWSTSASFPSAVEIADGRLWWFGADKEWGSVSDAYESFDEEVIGDAGPINRSIAVGGRNNAMWATVAGAGTLMIGCDSGLIVAGASSLDDIVTPENFHNRSLGPVGSAPLSPVEVSDDRVLFVEKAGNAIYEATFVNEKGRFVPTEFSKLTRDIYSTGIKQMAVQHRPDQRIWVVTEDADAVCVVFEPLEQVVAHIPISTVDTDGVLTDIIESVCVLPGTAQDRVYFVVKRTVNGSTKRYIERMALDTEGRPDDVTKCMDAHVSGTGAHSATITGLDHLEGRTVVAWVDGNAVNDAGTTDTKEFVVASGSITLPDAPTTGYCVGLPYRWRYKSPRLAYGVANATPMLKNKALAKIGLMLSDYCRSGIQYGTEFDNASHPLFDLPRMANAAVADEVVSGVGPDEDLMPTGGEITLDTRLCLEGRSPKPVTINALVMGIESFSR